MRQLQWQLGGEPPRKDGSVSGLAGFEPSTEQKNLPETIATIWFDTWRYQNEPVPVVALCQEMRRQMAGLYQFPVGFIFPM